MIFGERKIIPSISIPKPKRILMEGLFHYLGGVPEWLPEYDYVVEWLSDNKRKGLLAVGDPGRGKTRICMDVIPDILQYMGIECFRVSSYAMSRNFDEMLKASALMVDDVGIEDKASFYGERRDLFMEVVDNAERNGVLLIVTTNMTLDELTQRYGYRIIDRLRLIACPVVFKGESLRGKELGEPCYAYGLTFFSEKECEDFNMMQDDIEKGLSDGRYKPNDYSILEAHQYNEPLIVKDNIVYLYREQP